MKCIFIKYIQLKYKQDYRRMKWKNKKSNKKMDEDGW